MEYSGMYVTDFDKPPFVTSEVDIIKNTSMMVCFNYTILILLRYLLVDRRTTKKHYFL